MPIYAALSGSGAAHALQEPNSFAVTDDAGTSWVAYELEKKYDLDPVGALARVGEIPPGTRGQILRCEKEQLPGRLSAEPR